MKSVINLLFLLFASSVLAAPFWNPVVEEKTMSCKKPEVTFKIQEQFFSKPQILWKHPMHTKSEWEVFNGFPILGWDMQLAIKICSVSDFRAKCVITDPLNQRKIDQTINFLTGEFVFTEGNYAPVIFDCY
jgi:hypothetical protein